MTDRILELWLKSIDRDDFHPLRREARIRVRQLNTLSELEDRLRVIAEIHYRLVDGASKSGVAFAHHSWEMGDCCDGMGFEMKLIMEKILRLKKEGD